jgi:hypothetical protein
LLSLALALVLLVTALLLAAFPERGENHRGPEPDKELGPQLLCKLRGDRDSRPNKACCETFPNSEGSVKSLLRGTGERED